MSIKNAIQQSVGKPLYNAALAAGTQPPEDANPHELWVQLSSRKERPHKVFDFPRLGEDGKPLGQIAIITPTVHEIMTWNLAVEKELQELYKSEGIDTTTAERLTAIKQHKVMDQILSQAVRDPANLATKPLSGIKKNGKPARPSEVLTADEMAVLYRQYEITQSALGPIVSRMGDDTFRAWLAVIERGADDDSFLASLSLGAMTELVMLLAKELTSRTGSGLPGTQPGSPETGS